MNTKPLTRLVLSATIAAALISNAAHAQQAISPPATAPGSTSSAAVNPDAPQAANVKNASTLQQVVVTGNATLGGIKKIDAAYSITSLSAQQIKEANPKSAADLLKASPGIYAASSGGRTGANIQVGGFPGGSDAPYVTLQLNGSPVYPMSSLAYLENSSMLRLPDDTIERVELVQGGSAVLYGNGQPGLTANFILKEGTEVPSGDIGVTYGSEGMERLDGFIGFKLADNWLGSIGGWWRRSDGVRNPQFPADNGGSLTATLTRDWDSGSLMFYAPALKDHNQFVTDTPIYNPGKGQFSPYPGFSPLTGTFGSKADQREFLATTPCGTPGCLPGGVDVNLAKGRGADIHMFGSNFDWDFGNGWLLSNKLGFTSGQMNVVGLFSTGANPTTLGNYIAKAEVTNQLPTGLTAAATYTNGQAASMNQNVTAQSLVYVHKDIESISNEFHLSKELFDGNTLTLGNYTAVYQDHDNRVTGSQMLLQAQSNPNPIVVDLSDGANTWNLTSPQGFATAATGDLLQRWHGFNTALFATDSWKLGPWLFDGGVRVERQQASGGVSNTTKGDLDGDPYTLYNNNATYLAPGLNYIRAVRTAKSWTLGVNYEFNPAMSAYVRINQGVHFPGFDDLRGIPTMPVQKVRNYEIGYKYQAGWIYADLSAYRRLFYNVPYTFTDDAGNMYTYVYGSQAKGLNFSTTLKPLEHVSLTFSGDYMDGHYNHYTGCITYLAQNGTLQCTSVNGMQLQSQPKFQAHVTPAYELPTSWGSLRVWMTYEYIGDRYSDQIEQQPLGDFYDLSFGVIAHVGPHWVYSVTGTNMTNQIGITEGNGRLFGFASTGGVILARSIEGREVQGQIKYNF